ncbi:putative ribonuclease H-like domain-containing protein [Tanacetum coccineum]
MKVDSCSKSCVKAYATLKEQYDSLSPDYKNSQFNLVSYKVGLESVEARLAHYKKNEAVFEEIINVLNLEVKLGDNALVENKRKLEKSKKERVELKLTLEKFQNSSKSLNNLLESQVIDKFKTGLGYNAASSTAASPAVENFMNSSEIENIDVITVVTPSNGKKVESNHESADVKNNGDAVEFIPNVEDKTVRPSTEKIKFVKSARETVEKVATTMLVDSKLPTTFWAEAVNTACYVLNRVLVIKPHTKTPYELIHGRTPLIDFMKPFGCPVTILNTRDHLGKFDGKADEGFFIGYSVVSKAMRVFNKRTRIVEETLNIRFLENTPNVTGNGPDWLFDVDSLTISMNYVPVVAGNQTNGIAGTRDNIVTGQAEKKTEPEQEYILIPFCTTDPLISQGPKDSEEDSRMKPTEVDVNGASDKDGEDDQATRSEFERLLQQEKQTNSTNSFNTAGTPVSAAGPSFTYNDPSSPVNAAEASNAFEDHLFERFSPFKNAFTLPDVPNVFSIDDTRIFGNAYDDEDVGAAADLNNLETTMNVSPIPTTRIDKDHPKDQIIGDLTSAIQTRRMTKISDEHAMKVIQALEDPSWIEAMQEELLQFQLQKVWTLVNLSNGKRAIGTKWVFRNKKDERGIVVRNKARLVAQGYTQEEGIDYDEVFAPVARIKAIRLFLAYASFMGFIVYQDGCDECPPTPFLYGIIEEEVYVCQPPSFEDPQFPDKVYKVEKALFGLHQAPRAWYETLSTYLIKNGFRRDIIDKTLFIKKDKGDILLIQVHVDDMIFGSTKKSLCDEFEGLMHKRFQMSSMGVRFTKTMIRWSW